MEVVGHTRWHWVVHVECWAVHDGVWLETEVLKPTCWCWVRDVGVGRTC